ncbi:uncharacterized protein K02A2.6-like [Odontomachus brunneus]|uniref:uncharacterized protein K02A2.6-like n=1 Tax=Odontomachus brunneus TaxID=486640 RepID=UPI0013F29213|nr:uncharacterized protein K02A2.6-like [Odontomachus brunneus]
MRKRIKDHIENCITCLLANASQHGNEGEMQIVSVASAPLKTMHVDNFGSLQPSDEGYKYILVVVDAFTRFSWLFPSRTTGTRKTYKLMRMIFDVFGAPNCLVSDRGTAFTSSEFAEFMKEYQINHQKVVVAAPWANGIAERVNRFLKSSLSRTTEKAD